jgi:hypothetical protein
MLARGERHGVMLAFVVAGVQVACELASWAAEVDL